MTLEDKSQKGFSYSLAKDLKQIYGGGQVPSKTIKLPKVVYDRLKTFDTDEAVGIHGWTHYGIIKLILGEISEEDYWINPAINDEDAPINPPKEFYQWLDQHSELGPLLIMLAVTYGNYELEEEQ